MFFKANVEETEAILRCLTCYEKVSGQMINYHKSTVCFSSNTPRESQELISNQLSVPIASDFGKYLGLRSVIGRNKREVFNFIDQKVKQRIGSWQKKPLSRAGKETLLKSVAQSLPTYTMSVYQLPNSLCDTLQKVMNKYLREGSGNSGGLHWLSWDRLAVPKGQGGLGVKRLKDFNQALLAKQSWRLLTDPKSLVARIFKAKYYPQGTVLDATAGSNPSYVWRSILTGRDLLKEGVAKRIGNGRQTKIWAVPWLHDRRNPKLDTPLCNQYGDYSVSALMLPDGMGWNVDLLKSIFCPEDVQRIVKTLVNREVEDEWYWRHELRGCYSVRSGYRLQSLTQPSSSNFSAWGKIWKLGVTPKIRNLLWRCAKDILPVRTNLRKRRMNVTAECPLCSSAEETIIHIFLECPAVSPVWIAAGINTGPTATCFAGWLESWLTNSNDRITQKMADILWFIWCARNDAV